MAWENYIQITVPAGATATDLIDFPLMIRLSGSCGTNAADVSVIFEYLDDAYSSPYKLQLKDASDVEHYVEVVYWDLENSYAILYTKVDILSASDNVFKLYFDPSQPENRARVGRSQDAIVTNVWTDYVAVCHVPERYISNYQASEFATGVTWYSNYNAANEIAGLPWGKGYMFQGNEYMKQDYGGLGTVSTHLTIEALVRPDTFADTNERCAAVSKYCSYGGYSLEFPGGATRKAQLRLQVGLDLEIKTGTTDLADGNWHYVAGRRSSMSGSLWVDTAQEGSIYSFTSDPFSTTLGERFNIGSYRYSATSYDHHYYGGLSEVRVSSVSRSNDWLLATRSSLLDNLNTIDMTITAAYMPSAEITISGDIRGAEHYSFQIPEAEISVSMECDIEFSWMMQGDAAVSGPDVVGLYGYVLDGELGAPNATGKFSSGAHYALTADMNGLVVSAGFGFSGNADVMQVSSLGALLTGHAFALDAGIHSAEALAVWLAGGRYSSESAIQRPGVVGDSVSIQPFSANVGLASLSLLSEFLSGRLFVVDEPVTGFPISGVIVSGIGFDGVADVTPEIAGSLALVPENPASSVGLLRFYRGF